jgi:four helix bundle protein
MRRAAISVTSNISEGFGRKSYKDKSHFFQMSLGSVLELQNQLLIARNLEYISTFQYDSIIKLMISTEALCRGIIKKTNSFLS